MTEPAAGPPPTEEAARRAIGWTLVSVQFGLLGAVIWPVAGWWSPPGPVAIAAAAVRLLGLAISAIGAVGLGGALTPSPVPRRHAGLVSRGAYRWVRHPVYAGLLAFAFASVVAIFHPVRLAAALGLAALLTVKSRWEERLLAERVPGYSDYASSVGRFVPRLR